MASLRNVPVDGAIWDSISCVSGCMAFMLTGLIRAFSTATYCVRMSGEGDPW